MKPPIYPVLHLHPVTATTCSYGRSLKDHATGFLSPQFRDIKMEELHHKSDAINHAFGMLGLTWKSE